MSKKVVLKFTIVISITALVAILAGYLIPKVFVKSFENSYIQPKIEENLKTFETHTDELTDLLKKANSLDITPSVSVSKTELSGKREMTFSVDNLEVVIAFEYQLSGGKTAVTVNVKELETDLHSINAFESNQLNTVLTVLNEYFKTAKFTDSKSYFDEKYLIENFNSNQNNSTAEYNFGVHDNIYDATCIWDTEIVYSYKVSKLSQGYEFLMSVTYDM